MRSNGGRYSGNPSGNNHTGRALNAGIVPNRKRRCYQRRFWCTYAWNRPTSTGAGGSDPRWLCWRGKPWLAIRWRGYAASKWSQLERQLILGQRLSPIARSSISLADRIQARADGGSGCVLLALVLLDSPRLRTRTGAATALC